MLKSVAVYKGQFALICYCKRCIVFHFFLASVAVYKYKGQ
jgi:hypothetical protein